MSKSCTLHLQKTGLTLANLKLYQRIYTFFLKRRLVQYEEWVNLEKPSNFSWLTTVDEQGTFNRLVASHPEIALLPPSEVSLVKKQLHRDFKIWRKDDLTCDQCGKIVPRSHGIYANDYRYKIVFSGDHNIFCGKGCGAAWHHAHRTPDEKTAYTAKIVNSRINRSPEEKVASAKKLSESFKNFTEEKKLARATKIRETSLALGSYEAAAKKREKTLIERYGSEYGKKRQATYKKTMLKKEGVTNSWSNGSSGRETYNNTIREKYGVEYVTQNAQVKKKLVATYVENNGGMGRASPSAREAQEQTMLKRYGVKNSMHIPEVRAKMIATFKASGKFKSQKTKEKNGTTPKQVAWKGHETKKRNGTYSTNRAEQYVLLKLRSLLGEQVIHLYRDHPNYPWEADFFDPTTETIYEFQGYFTHGGEVYDKNNRVHRKRVKELTKSKDKWASKVTLRVWTKTDPQKRKAVCKFGLNFVEWFSLKEFDTWLESEIAKRVAATRYKDGCFKIDDKYLIAHDSKYLSKFKESKHLVFYPWDNLKKVVSHLKNKKVFYARQLEVTEIPKDLADKFCDKYHLQNSCKGSKLAVGIFTKGDKRTLLGVMTFGKPRYNKKYDYELLRLCFSANIVGGSQRLFKFAVSKLEKGSSIISYCDLSKFNGSVYAELGFESKKSPRPSIHWYNPSTGQRVTDNMLRQHGFDRLVGKKLGVSYGKGTCNETLMRKHQFKAIYDLGQATYIYKGMK